MIVMVFLGGWTGLAGWREDNALFFVSIGVLGRLIWFFVVFGSSACFISLESSCSYIHSTMACILLLLWAWVSSDLAGGL
jgi:hypothetical protein